MREFVYYEELIHRHKNCWHLTIENKGGYKTGFLSFVERVLATA
jgi:hypothetical protein